MRSVVVLLVVVAAFIAGPALVCAQGLLGLPSLFGKGGTCDPGAIELYVGYASNGGMTRYSEDWPSYYYTGGETTPDFDYATTHALYLGAGLPIRLGDALTFRLAGSVTVPATWKVEQLTPAAQVFFLPPDWHLRDWKGDTIWGTVEGLAGYQFGSGFSAVAGFRWDHWQTSLKHPSNERGGVGSYGFATTDTADLTVNAYMPLVGGITNQGGFAFGVLGFPVALGDLESHESRNFFVQTRLTTTSSFSQGYYLEVFTEWTLPTISLLDIGSDGSASLFAKFNSFEAKGRHPVTINSGGFISTQDVDFSFRRNLFIVGAKGTINFSMPDLSGYF